MLRAAVRGDALVRRMGARAELLASGVLFGGLMTVAVRAACQGPGSFSAGQVAVVRFGIGALTCLVLFALRPGTFRPVRLRLLATRGLLGGLTVMLYFASISRIGPGKATLLHNTHPMFATLIAIAVLGERPTWRLAGALALTTGGLGVVLASQAGPGLSFGLGEVAGLGSAVVAAAAVTTIRALRPTDNASTIFFAFCMGGLAVTWPFALAPWPTDPGLWLAALAAAFLAVGYQLLLTDALGFLGVAEVAAWQQASPVSAFLWAAFLLGESVGLLSAVGIAFVIAGVACGGFATAPKSPA